MTTFEKVNQPKLIKTVNATFSNLHAVPVYSFLKENGLLEQGKDQLAQMCVGLFQFSSNQQFHDNLNFFERMGFLSKQKEAQHQRLVALKSGALDGVIRVGADLLLYNLEQRKRQQGFDSVLEFYVGWMTTINGTQTRLMQSRTESFYQSMGRNFSPEQFQSIVDKYLDSDKTMAPRPKLDEVTLQDMFKSLITGVDIESEAVQERIKEFGGYVNMKDSDVEALVTEHHNTSEVISSLHQFTALGYDSLFHDLVDDAEKARQSAVFLNEHDPFSNYRAENKQKLLKGVSAGVPILLSFVTGPVGDVVLGLAGATAFSMLDKDSAMDTIRIQKSIKQFTTQLKKSDGNRRNV